MKSVKKVFKIILIVFLIVLALLGIGIGGAVPLSSSNKKENSVEIKVELLDTKETKEDLKEFEIKE